MENPSPELQHLDAFVAMIQRVLEDAMARLAEGVTDRSLLPVGFSTLDVCSFRQTWPDASCGFGGIAAQVLTDAQTVVVSWRTGNTGNVALVYIRGDFAYLVSEPTSMFWQSVQERHIPGATEPRAYLSGGNHDSNSNGNG